MANTRRSEGWVALLLVGPFVCVYGWMFIYPSLQMAWLSFTDAPLIGAGEWNDFKNYDRLTGDRTFGTAIWNTLYFVLLTVIPGTLTALGIALMVSRLKGWLQSGILAAFFLPYILPVSVVYRIWQWVFDLQFGIAQYVLEPIVGEPVAVWRRYEWFMPAVGLVTIWWTCGFSILLFLAGLRNIPKELYEAASLDGADRWVNFRRITWPLIWPVTALVMTIQLILQLKIFDQVYLFAQGGRTNTTMVLVQYIYEQAFVHNRGGYAATVALALFVLIVVVSVLQYQSLRARGGR
ncbi:MAG: sugar ABC transporter permease [Alphaproteobacteria bacterium]